MMDAVAKMDIKVRLINKVLRDIGAKKDHYTLIHEAQLLRNRVEELLQEMEKFERRLGELAVEMVCRDFSTHSILNYNIQVVKRAEMKFYPLLVPFVINE